MDLGKVKKNELLKSPTRKWNDVENEYDFILLVPGRTKHESGFMHIAVIGVSGEDMEICAWPDDISCHFPVVKAGPYDYPSVRMDCFYPSGVLRYHGRGKFKVGHALSSIDIYFTPAKPS